MRPDRSLGLRGYALYSDNRETSRGRNVLSCSLSLWFVGPLERGNRLGRTVVVSCSVELMRPSADRFIFPKYLRHKLVAFPDAAISLYIGLAPIFDTRS